MTPKFSVGDPVRIRGLMMRGTIIQSSPANRLFLVELNRLFDGDLDAVWMGVEDLLTEPEGDAAMQRAMAEYAAQQEAA